MSKIDEIIASPLHVKQITIIRMDRDIAVRTFSIKLCYRRSSVKGHDPADDIVYFHVLQRERLLRNAVVDAMTLPYDPIKVRGPKRSRDRLNTAGVCTEMGSCSSVLLIRFGGMKGVVGTRVVPFAFLTAVAVPALTKGPAIGAIIP